MATSVSVSSPPQLHFEIRRVPALQPLKWLDRGWDDLRTIGSAGLAHGALIAILGGVLLMLGSSHMYLVAAAVSGYLLVGPIMTTGLCELARRRETHETLSFDDSLQALSRNAEGLLQFGGILAALALLWFVLSAVLLATVLSAPAPSLAVALWGGSMLVSSSQLVGYILCGAVLAVIVFAMSTVAVPLLIDRHASAWEAIRTSLHATLINLPAMLVWALLIVGLTAIGFLTLLVGMVVLAPLLGYATWHAYRDLIVP
jgi:uncharacterized membrane protein